jgi:hypothetical protein
MTTANRQKLMVAALAALAIGAFFWFRPSRGASAPTRQDTGSNAPVASPKVPGAAARTGKVELPATIPPVAQNPNNERTIPWKEVDPEQERKARAEQELTYRIRRLRFLLNDAAADCYSGPPSKDQITLAYTLVVEKETLRVENVRVGENSIRDTAVSDCLISAVKDLRSIAPSVGDLRQEETSTISLSDLTDNNRRQDRGNSP